MSVSSTISSVTYAGNASTSTAYPVTFQFFDATDLTVYVVDSAGVSTTLVLGTGYTVSGGAGSTGNVFTTSAVPGTSQVVITRNTAKTQLTSYTTGDRFPAATHEKALDKLTFIAQENARKSMPDTAATAGSAPYVLGLSATGGTPTWTSQSSASIADGSITPAKLSAGKPTWDTSGNLTATSFIGPVTGNVTGNLTGNVTGSGISTFAGNVGIGTSSPITKLNIQRASGNAITEDVRITDGTQVLSFNNNSTNAAFNPLVQAGDAIVIYSKGTQETGSIVIGPHSSSTKGIRIAADGTIATGGNPITNCKTTAKAWVNFNGAGTPAIRASYNVSSITKNGTGDYTVNFATAMADANYSYVGSSRYNRDDTTGYAPALYSFLSDTKTTSSVRVRSYTAYQAVQDSSEVNLLVFGN